MLRSRVWAPAEADPIDDAGKCVDRCPPGEDCRSGCEALFGILADKERREREEQVRERERLLEAREAAQHDRESHWGKLQGMMEGLIATRKAAERDRDKLAAELEARARSAQKGEHGPPLRTYEHFDPAADYEHHALLKLNGTEGFINRAKDEDGKMKFHFKPTEVDGVRCSWKRVDGYQYYSCPELFVKDSKYHFSGSRSSLMSNSDPAKPFRKCDFVSFDLPGTTTQEHQQLQEPIVRAINRGPIPRE
eukprot:TRINITY_DN707_c0_g4_i1.p2 TRINITY_DN707_c0_g4~~TRINITY_DN707_c0_g4_i1.p2  ORF type:complete len:283 (+),score=108.51 TRINITY_DN707_c0_g4_i1:102-851(+)